MHSKTETSYAIIQEYSQEYLQPKIDRKIRYQLRAEKQYSSKKRVYVLCSRFSTDATN